MPDAVQLIRSPDLFAGVEYAYASAAAAGARLVFLAGSCPLDTEGNVVGGESYSDQAAQCVANLVRALDAAGATLTDVVSTRVLVASSDRADLGAVWRVVRDAFGEHDAPSTLIGVTVLGYEGQLVEVEAVAALLPAAVDVGASE